MLVGIDEVGRGCWAGPLVAAAVILGESIVGLRDSKKLTKLSRQRLAVQIMATARSYGIGWVDVSELDEIGLTAAVRLAMSRALAEINIDYDEIIIDGNYNFFPHDKRCRALIKADDSVDAVSAASIIAKVSRDKFMVEQADIYKGYGFEAHVGYGTQRHVTALHMHGVSKIHRRSFKPIQQLLKDEFACLSPQMLQPEVVEAR